MKTDKLTKFIMRCLLALSLGGVGQAYAGVCEISLEANPPFPETIASTQVVGTVVYQGNLTWRFFRCLSIFGTSGSYALIAGGPQPTPVWGVTGLTVEAGSPIVSNMVNTISHVVDARFLSTSNVYFISTTNNGDRPSINPNFVISFDVTQPITIKASATTVSGKFPDPANGSVLQDRKSMHTFFKNRCMAGPWVMTFEFSDCTALGWGIASPLNGSKVGEPQITLTPTVPRIVSGSASSDQNCKPVLRSSITIPNLKTP
jgi:hypothetical protein